MRYTSLLCLTGLALIFVVLGPGCGDDEGAGSDAERVAGERGETHDAGDAQAAPPKPSGPESSAAPPEKAATTETPATAATSSSRSANTLVFKKHTFQKPNDLASHTAWVPEGWTAEGGSFWPPPQLFRINPSQNISFTAPDGRAIYLFPTLAAYDFLPSQLAIQQFNAQRPREQTVTNGKPVIHMPQTLDDWQAWIRKHGIDEPYPNASAIEVGPVEIVPSLTKLLRAQMQGIKQQEQQLNQLSQEFGTRQQQWSDGHMLSARATYRVDGKAYEQVWLWGHVVIGTDSDNGRELLWSVEPNLSFRAPEGELEEQMPLLMGIANSVRMTRPYAKFLAGHYAKMQQIDQEAFVKRQTAHTQFSNEMREIINDTYQNTSSASDYSHEQYMKSLNEVTDYEIPGTDGESIALPIHYDHYFCDGDTLIMTNDPTIKEAQNMPKMYRSTGRR